MKESLPPLGEVLSTMRLIWRLNRGLELSSRRMQSSLGITGPQRLALRMIGRFPRITAAQLSVILSLDRSTTSTLLSGLAKKRLVAQKINLSDKRRILLTLTDKGRALDKPAEGTIEYAVTQLLNETDPEALEQASRFLQKLGDILCKDDDVAQSQASRES